MKDTFIALFIQKFEELFNLFRDRKDNKSENEFYRDRRVSDSEHEGFVTDELCEYIDTYYEKKREFMASGQDPDEWFKKDVDKSISDVMPDASEEERDEIMQEVLKGIDDQNSDIADALEYSMKNTLEIVSDSEKKEGGVK